MNRAGENILMHWKAQPYKWKTNIQMSIPNTAVYMFKKSWPHLHPVSMEGLVRSAASMAALTFSLASSETKQILTFTEEPKNKRDLSAPDRTLRDVLLLPQATTQDICGLSFNFGVCVRTSLPPGFFPSRHWLKAPSSQLVPGKQALHDKHLTSVSAWEHLALSASQGPPSVCLSDWYWAYTYCQCAPVFHSYTSAGLTHKNQST